MKFDILQYDFHIHTSYTDGNSTIREIAEAAKRAAMTAIAITEHVRMDLVYDYAALADEVKRAETEYGLRILLGAEAKILDERGNLDCPESVIQRADFIIGSIHRIPAGATRESLLYGILRSRCNVIGHPIGVTAAQFDEIKDSGKFLELNEKYGIGIDTVQSCAQRGIPFSIGTDAHCAGDVGRYEVLREVVGVAGEGGIAAFLERYI